MHAELRTQVDVDECGNRAPPPTPGENDFSTGLRRISRENIKYPSWAFGQRGLCETQFEKVERSHGVERCGVGACGSSVVGVHASPRFEL
jgi:hypothetical protein